MATQDARFDQMCWEDDACREPMGLPPLDNTSRSGGIEGCPQGCTTHVAGCDIKGNISFDTGEKIYHVPGQEYYDSSSISPEFGERWFCAEQEAISNGWRKAFK